ncbi:glycoside hydrolase family 9 protein [Heterobasidion irregulare TC 32-1]|uniref:cellulase n=1 Tax=Heterobasidion irregulare (strain TC 32-1) TaxID=747525 RepID=W4KFP9_HETIT|nr:glycoside hydrolase family 9 protein [Heterobasidion irregulare TC 32-1]ETW84554.1 glycoside hydrolase family 9 protein [Heterobasidion irregulare TC 32-1]
MFLSLFLLIFAQLARPVLSQLPLPNTPWMPPDASSGAERSSEQSTPNTQWTTLLGNLLYFYEVQRSGKLPSNKRVPWRNDSSLDDGKDVNLDLTGGYYDAGDYIKCTFPFSLTLMSVCWGANDFGQGYDMANQTAYLDDMLRWGLDWLMKAHPSPNTLFVQVGDTEIDNDYWGGDLNIPLPRPSYQINATNPGTDASAGASAAFAACSNLYANRSLSTNGAFSAPASLQNATYASLLLNHSQALYSFATGTTQQTYQTGIPPVGEAYPSTAYGDELAIAALMLAWATGSSDLYAQAETYYTQFSLGGQDVVFDWDSKTPGIAVLFAQLAQADPTLAGNLSSWQSEAERYFDRIVDGTGRGRLTKGGLLWYDGDSDNNSLNPALNAAMLLTRYAPLATTSDKRSSYLAFAKGQVDYALGKNPMSAPYVVGVNPNAPTNPQSAMASGGSDISAVDTSPPEEAYVIYGGVVGGPDTRDRFFNIRSDWVETEVALDYNAPLLTLTAAHVMGDTADPYYTRLQAGAYAAVKPQGRPCDNALTCHGGLSRGAKIAIGVVVSIVGLLIIGLSIWFVRRMRRGGSILRRKF